MTGGGELEPTLLPKPTPTRLDLVEDHVQIGTPGRVTTSKACTPLFTPPIVCRPSPGMVPNYSYTPATTPRGPAGSLDYATDGMDIPPSIPESLSKDMIELPCPQASCTADKDGRSVGGCFGAVRNTMKLWGSESLLANANIRAVIATYALYLFVFSGCSEVLPLWALSSVARGGLDWTTEDLGKLYIPCGVSILVFEMIVIPCVTKRIGVTISQRLAALGSALGCLAIPFLSRLSGAGAPLFWAALVVLFTNHACPNAMFLNVSVAINNCTDESRRGEVNGLATTSGSVAEAVGPVFFSVVFAASINHDNSVPFDFHLVFFLMAILMVLVMVIGWHSIQTVYREESVVGVRKRSGSDQAEATAGTRSKNALGNVDGFPVVTADEAVCV